MNWGAKVSAAATCGHLEVVLQGFEKLLGCVMLRGLGAPCLWPLGLQGWPTRQ